MGNQKNLSAISEKKAPTNEKTDEPTDDMRDFLIVTCSSHHDQLQSSNAGATLIQNMEKEKVALPLQDNVAVG